MLDDKEKKKSYFCTMCNSEFVQKCDFESVIVKSVDICFKSVRN